MTEPIISEEEIQRVSKFIYDNYDKDYDSDEWKIFHKLVSAWRQQKGSIEYLEDDRQWYRDQLNRRKYGN